MRTIDVMKSTMMARLRVALIAHRSAVAESIATAKKEYGEFLKGELKKLSSDDWSPQMLGGGASGRPSNPIADMLTSLAGGDARLPSAAFQITTREDHSEKIMRLIAYLDTAGTEVVAVPEDIYEDLLFCITLQEAMKSYSETDANALRAASMDFKYGAVTGRTSSPDPAQDVEKAPQKADESTLFGIPVVETEGASSLPENIVMTDAKEVAAEVQRDTHPAYEER